MVSAQGLKPLEQRNCQDPPAQQEIFRASSHFPYRQVVYAKQT